MHIILFYRDMCMPFEEMSFDPWLFYRIWFQEIRVYCPLESTVAGLSTSVLSWNHATRRTQKYVVPFVDSSRWYKSCVQSLCQNNDSCEKESIKLFIKLWNSEHFTCLELFTSGWWWQSWVRQKLLRLLDSFWWEGHFEKENCKVFSTSESPNIAFHEYGKTPKIGKSVF